MGAPYFNRFFIPVGLALLFLMAVAPALPWRKTTVEVMRGRLAVPAALGVLAVVVCVAGRHPRGRAAAGLRARRLRRAPRPAGPWSSRSGAPAAGPAVAGASPARSALAGWRGFVGRANGGMVVHIGVVVIAVGLAAATSFLHRGRAAPGPGPDGHLRRAYRRVRRHPDGDLAVPLGVRGRPAGRRRRPVLSGHQPVRSGTQRGRDPGHRLQLDATTSTSPSTANPRRGRSGPSGWWSSLWSCGCGSAPA